MTEDEDREFYRSWKQRSKEKFVSDRKKFLEEAIQQDDGKWIKHTEYHWSRVVNGSKLDYWPSRKKWQYKGKIQRGNVMMYIKRIQK